MKSMVYEFTKNKNIYSCNKVLTMTYEWARVFVWEVPCNEKINFNKH